MEKKSSNVDMSLIQQAKKALKLNGLDAYKVLEDPRF
jgi:hypothetical protein